MMLPVEAAPAVLCNVSTCGLKAILYLRSGLSNSSTTSSQPSSVPLSTYIPSSLLSSLSNGRLENSTAAAVSASLSIVSQSPTPTVAPLLSQPTASSSPTIAAQVAHPPFNQQEAVLGLVPTTSLDVPITAVFLVLFIIGAVTHFTIHELNQKRGHKFHLSDMVFDFCMVRTVTCTMRIVWAFRPANNSVVLAAQIFENAGVVVLFAVNVIFTQRILRAAHPHFGWNPITGKIFLLILITIPIVVILNIASLTVTFFTLVPQTLSIARSLLIFGASWNFFLALLPIIVTAAGTTIPSSSPVEKFGVGRFRYKAAILVFAATTLSIGAVTRLIGAAQVHPAGQPGQVDSKAVFYTTGFMLEIIVVASYAVLRIDLRFHIPNGSSGPGDYSARQSDEEELFQDVDVKMRVSIGESMEGQMWKDAVPDRSPATRAQVRQAIYDLQLNFEIIGQPIDTGDSEILLYAFRVKKLSSAELPSRPPRSGTWTNLRRDGPNGRRQSVF